MENTLCNMLGIKYPIFQGAMAWIADASLASAVSEAGGLGIIAAGNAPVDVVREEIRITKELTDKPFGVNIMLLSPHVDEIAELVAEEKIKVITTGAGAPAKFMDLWKSSGTKVIPVVPSVAIAKKMEQMGADAVIAEGMESGGHIGKLTTITLTTQVVNNVSIPVVAAGGIYDGRGMAAAFALGAKGIQLGTRFLLAKECTVHRNYKNAIIKARDIDTVITGNLTGHPVRVLKNKLARILDKLEKENWDPKKFDELGTGALQRATKEGDLENGSIMAGQIAGAINEEQTAKEIIDDIVNGFRSTISELKTLNSF